ncbi:pyridoxal phosphate-dependent aminotransferase [Natronincola ferrireducens]|uniref:Aminotransferase n=1 Tax=Natronincola ferrireducens TaxID=393762 RepID=A0A1G9GXU9_9FIRM|nr:pyridoxal phosphate-dependent aminotransferase [Natronincola ferrireducens]SDL05093.1 Aspartate/methionine/tyrosine aminotransferase [Natronincola ferrireducens]
MNNKMREAFQKIDGGLFSSVSKADVGDAYDNMQKDGVRLMAWADPFYPDSSIPEHVKKATIKVIENGFSSHYTVPIGNMVLKQEISKKLLKYNGIKADPKRNILITPGSDSGLFYAMLPFVQNGDEIMIVDPSYPNNFQNTDILGGVIVRVPVYEENNFQLNINEFKKRLTDKTKMVVLTNPNNPTTTVYRRECLEQLRDFIVENDLILVVDQAFEMPVFDDIEMVTVAALEGMWERTLTVFSLSKGMGLSGYRVGYIVADDKIMDKLYAATVSVLGATNTAAQIGCIEAMKDDSFLEEYFKVHLERRDMVYNLLKDVPGIVVHKSESGFLSWINVSKLGSSQEIVDYLIKEAKVAVNIGEPYGLQGEGYIRIVHGVLGSTDDLRGCIEDIKKALTKLAYSKGYKGV